MSSSPLYFEAFEGRRPPPAVPYSPGREFVFQSLATMAIALGFWYLSWRWTASLNPDALWFAVPLAIAETLAFVGTISFYVSIWKTADTPWKPPPATVNDILATPVPQDRPLVVDVMFATYNEDLDLVRLSIRDAKKLTYPHPIDVRIHVLDDGRREAARTMAEEEGVTYHSRPTNIGYKAGNLRNGLARTVGDLIVICDADTRVFPSFLERTLGYFRDPTVAWTQTPQWFYDLDEGTALPEWLGQKLHLGALGRLLGRVVEGVIGPVRIGADPLGNDPGLFYDVIQRRRNWCNASFCCGAGSVHRREAVMEASLRALGEQIQREADRFVSTVPDPTLAADLDAAVSSEAARAIELTPYEFHVSEDIYTSIVLHADPDRRWRSVYHPEVLSRMLSPQDLLAWSIQRFKYAGGTLDIARNDNPLRRPGLSFWQKVMYGSTIWSYLAPIWTVVFLAAPVIYLFSGIAPVAAYGRDFYAHIVPFLVVNKLAFMLGTWGVPSWRGEQYYLGFFWLNLQALGDVIRGRPVKFHVTPKTREARSFLSLVRPQLVVIGVTTLGLVVMGLRLLLGAGGDASAYVVNLFWCANNILSLSAIVFAAARRPEE